jgi:hypothetical protein
MDDFLQRRLPGAGSEGRPRSPAANAADSVEYQPFAVFRAVGAPQRRDGYRLSESGRSARARDPGSDAAALEDATAVS